MCSVPPGHITSSSFIKTTPAKARQGQAAAAIHTEYTHAILTSAPLACRRSARAELSIECATKTATTEVIYGFEGRAATGKTLTEFRARQAPTPFNDGLIGQVGKAACPGQ